MKHLLALLATATLSSALVQADTPARPNQRTNTKTSQEPTRPADDKYGPFLRQGFFLTADFLYWIAHEEGLEFATTGVAGTSNTTSVAPGSAQKMNFKWKPGVRVGLGWTLPNSYWDFGATWTGYSTTAKSGTSSCHSSNSTVSHRGDPNLNPLFSSLEAPFASDVTNAIVVGTGALDSATARWRLCYDTLDFELARSFYPNKHLSLRPHAGIRGAWLHQSYSNVYSFNNGTSQAVVSRRLSQRHNSAGFKTGLDTLWSCNRYWGIFANSSLSLLGGNYNISETDKVVSDTVASTPSVGSNFISTSDKVFAVTPVLETAMGLRLTLGPKRMHYWFDLNAGWEYLVWFNENQMPLFVDDVARGTFIRERANLHLMGFTLDAKLHF